MTELTPHFASEKSAARLLDMKTSEFVRLVADGHLPKPRDIGGHKRWDMLELRQIISGQLSEGMGDVKW